MVLWGGRANLIRGLRAVVLAAVVVAVLAGSPYANTGQRPDPGSVRSITADVLARPEFRPDMSETWKAKAINWLAEKLGHFLEWLSSKSGLNLSESGFLVRAIIVVTVLIFAVAACLLLMRLLRRRGGGVKGRPQTEAVVSHRRASAPDLAREAFSRAENGDIGEAFRLLYVALLYALDRSGVINWNRSSTNWDYVRALKRDGRADLAEEVEELTRVFDLTHYGARTCRTEQYEACLRAYQGVMAGQGRAA